MKNQLLLALILVFSSSAFAQYSRTIYTSEGFLHRHSVLIERSNTTELVSIRASHGDTLVVSLISVDSEGNTSNYRISEYTSFNTTAMQLSGAGVGSDGKITLCILRPITAQFVVRYITIDPISGTFSNFHQLPSMYRTGFSNSIAKGDSLITYLGNTVGGNNGIHRVAASMSNTSSNSITAADPTLTISSSGYQYAKGIDLLIDGDIEYIGFSNTILKRTISGSFQNITLPSAPATCTSLMKNNLGEIVVFRGQDYSTISTSFTLSTSGTYQGANTFNLGAEEMYALNNGSYRIWSHGSQGTKQIDLDANFNVISSNSTDNITTFSTKIGSKVYIVGLRRIYPSETGVDGVKFLDTPYSLTLICDDLTSSIESFVEYNRELIHHKIHYHTNHCGISFNKPNFTAGLTYVLDSIERSLIYSSKLDIGAKTQSGDTLLFAGKYTTLAIPGPYTNPNAYGFEDMDKYNRGYYVTREMIESHITGIGLNDPNYEMPFSIHNWPAHGDVNKGQAADLAGFIDLDGNNIYNPENGDYPAIYGDACLLNIFHQSSFAELSTSFEIHQYFFSFDCLNDEDLENTIFTRTDNFSRTHDLVELYAGNYVDFDIGNYSDDYVGSNVELGIIYGYNGDLNDETNGGNVGFGARLPVMGVMTLQGVKLTNIGTDRPIGVGPGESINGIGFGDGIPNNEHYTLESSLNATNSVNDFGSFYQAMTGTYPNGVPQTVNGVTVRHTSFGNSDPLFYSSGGIDHGNNDFEFTLNTPGDRRMSGASGPADLAQQDTLILYNAFVLGLDSVNASIDSSLTRLFERSANIRTMFRTNTTPCGGNFGTYVSESTLNIVEPELHEFLIYPNPANLSFRVRGISGQANVVIYDLNGRVVTSETNFMDGQEISISHLDNAIYLVSIEDEVGRQVLRLVKR